MDMRLIAEKACELGFGDVGVCNLGDFFDQKAIVDAQPRLQERRQLRFSPMEDYPWASALLVLLWPYDPAKLPDDEDEVFIDSYYYASNAAYHASQKMEEWLKEQGVRAKANVPYPAREAALRAGLGLIGHNGLLIHPRFGTRTVIILLATDALKGMDAELAEKRERCLGCMRCVKACPMGAIDEKGMSHPERCLRNFMMEGIVVPQEVRSKMGMKLLGCDNCQRVCPMQQGRQLANQPHFKLDPFLTTDDAAFRDAVSRLGELIGRNAARPQRVKAQAALLAGNRKKEKDIQTLECWSDSQFEAVKEHAKWALDQIHTYGEGLDQTGEKR